MREALLIICSLVILGCNNLHPNHKYLLGTWKSNERMTLESMNNVSGVTNKARALFENDFFGHLVVEYKENESRSINEKDVFDTGYQPYEVIGTGNNFIRIKEINEILGEFETTIYPEGKCYYVITYKYKFREYFCKAHK